MLPIGNCLAWNCVVLILLYNVNSGFASPIQRVLEKSEVATSNLTVKLQEAYVHLVDFFRPVTCNHKDEQTLIPCHVGEGLNTTECLESKCCPSETIHELPCYMPLKDKRLGLEGTSQEYIVPAQGQLQQVYQDCVQSSFEYAEVLCQEQCQDTQLAFRVLVLVAGGLLILGCLPFCCCACLQRSPCINPLRKANKKVKKIVLEKRAHDEDVRNPLLR